MAQLTPYGDGYFQLHGMTKEITLFEDGLVESTALSAQPELPVPLLSKIRCGWREEILGERTHNAIQHMAQFIPDYKTAEKVAKHCLVLNRFQAQILCFARQMFHSNKITTLELKL